MLPRLNPDPNVLTDVQQTAFSYDFLGRWACSTWAEVSNNGGFERGSNRGVLRRFAGEFNPENVAPNPHLTSQASNL